MLFSSVAAAGLSKRGSSFSAYIIKIVHLFIRKFCPTFFFKKMLCDTVVPTRRLFQWLDQGPLNGQQSEAA